MSNFSIIRLGKESVEDIRRLDSLHESPAEPIRFKVLCAQVPREFAVGDYAFFCLGSDNNKGIPTAWTRGVRAFGTVVGKDGGPGYNDQWEIGVEIKVILPESVTQKDLLAEAASAYYWCSDVPVLGIDTHSNQTIQLIKTEEPTQNVAALAYCLNVIFKSFRSDVIRTYPELEDWFEFKPPTPDGSPRLVRERLSRQSRLDGMLDRFKTDSEQCALSLEEDGIHRFFSCLLAKKFLILTGLSGSGKTKIAQAFAEWATPGGGGHYRLVSVGADWTTSDDILGYPNGLDEKSYITAPSVDLLIQAGKEEFADIPHFLILDEMNLSHVERYFADVLSSIESNDGLSLYPGDMNNPENWRKDSSGQPIPPRIERIPDNLFIIGTVNVDETTYMFSPKVLDRANVLEFRMPRDDLKRFLDNPRKPNLARLTQRGHDEGFGKAFAEASRFEAILPEGVKDDYEEEMLLFFDILKEHGAEFGYRTAHEAARFIHFFKLLGGFADGSSEWFPGAFDCVVVQKFLPKLHGSRAKLAPLLKALWFLCVTTPEARGEKPVEAVRDAARSTDPKNEPSADQAKGAHYLLSADKIARMWCLLKENGFASFAEA